MNCTREGKGRIETGLRCPIRGARSLLVVPIAAVVFACAAAGSPNGGESPSLSRTVIVVRHAEKADHPRKDPGLTVAGVQRAAVLADLLEQRGVDLIITSELRRSRETAANIAARSGLQPRVVPVNSKGGLDAHIREITMLVGRLEPGTTTLVVGHSFTIEPLLAAFGVSGGAGLYAETDYSKLFEVTISEDGSTSLARGNYGAAPTPEAAGGGWRRSPEEKH